MKELKISSVIRRKKKKYTKNSAEYKAENILNRKYTKNSAEYKAENILNRKFSADIPQQKVLTDITEFKYGKDKKIYMCAALDLYDRSILSYSLSEKPDTKLVLEVLQNSFSKTVNHNTILHTDRGSQFTSSEYKKTLENL